MCSICSFHCVYDISGYFEVLYHPKTVQTSCIPNFYFISFSATSELEMTENLRQTVNQENRKEDASPLERQPINLLERSSDSYGIEGSFPQPPPSSLYAEAQRIPRASPFAYGDADRLPGHPGMGGMMMDPLRSGGMGLRPPHMPGIPRGSVPPGARFDPYGPLTEFDYSSGSRVPRRSFNPNPDHLRRPGFDDDMFM